MRTFVEITQLYFLVIAALRAGERAHLAGAEGGDDGGLVPVEDVAAFLALLPESHDRTPLVYDHTPRDLYRHATASRWSFHRGIENDCTPNTRDALREGLAMYLRGVAARNTRVNATTGGQSHPALARTSEGPPEPWHMVPVAPWEVPQLTLWFLGHPVTPRQRSPQ